MDVRGVWMVFADERRAGRLYQDLSMDFAKEYSDYVANTV